MGSMKFDIQPYSGKPIITYPGLQGACQGFNRDKCQDDGNGVQAILFIFICLRCGNLK